MYKLSFIFVFVISLNTQPLFSQNDNLYMSVGTTFNSGNVLGVYNDLRTHNKNNVNLNLEYRFYYLRMLLSRLKSLRHFSDLARFFRRIFFSWFWAKCMQRGIIWLKLHYKGLNVYNFPKNLLELSEKIDFEVSWPAQC